MSSNTALSPSLAHLLIKEDRSTGRLVLPNGSSLPNLDNDIPPLPALSPPQSRFGSYSPLPPVRTKNLTLRLPEARRPEGLFSLLNDLSVRTPSPGTSESDMASPVEDHSHLHPGDVQLQLQHQHGHSIHSSRSSGALRNPVSRPEMKRHPSSPGQIYSRPAATSYEAPSSVQQGLGGRVPISRTTKACNACRSRKVRCDAGGATGEPTTCSRCKEAGVECTYSGTQKKRGPCPGTSRSSQSGRTRGPSRRSSAASATTPFVLVTPGTDGLSYPHQGRRGSGFPFPSVAQTAPKLPPGAYPSMPPVSSSAYHPPSYAPEPWNGGWTSNQPLPQPRPATATGAPSAYDRRSSVAMPPPISTTATMAAQGRKWSYPGTQSSWSTTDQPSVFDPSPRDCDHAAAELERERARERDLRAQRERERRRETEGPSDIKRFFDPSYTLSGPPPPSRLGLSSVPSMSERTSFSSSMDIENKDGPARFGGEGRTLPPLNVMIGRRSSYYAMC